MSDLPENRVNWITKIFVNSCAAKPYIYIELAYEAELRLIYNIFGPDIWLVTEMVTGHGLRHHGKRQMREAEEAGGDWLVNKARWIFAASEWLNFALFWICVFETVRDTFIWWSSQVMQVDFVCHHGSVDSAWSNDPIWGSPMSFANILGPTYLTIKGDIGPYFYPGASLNPGDTMTATFWVKLHPLIGTFSGGYGSVKWVLAGSGDVIGEGNCEVDVANHRVYFGGHLHYKNNTDHSQLVQCFLSLTLDSDFGTLINEDGQGWLTVYRAPAHN